MRRIVKGLSHPFQVSVGLVWAICCCLVFIATGSVFGKQPSSPMDESKHISAVQGHAKGKPTPRRWTVLCERDDGTQGIFRVSSNLYDSSIPVPSTVQGEPQEGVQDASSEPTGSESTMNDEHEDPFGSPTLKCGKLLTLLAIFATAEATVP